MGEGLGGQQHPTRNLSDWNPGISWPYFRQLFVHWWSHLGSRMLARASVFRLGSHPCWAVPWWSLVVALLLPDADGVQGRVEGCRFVAKAAGHLVFAQAPLHCAAAQVSRRLDRSLAVFSDGLFVLPAVCVISQVVLPVHARLAVEGLARAPCSTL
jgi:hypothetical protein